jgi:hypothetical protein
VRCRFVGLIGLVCSALILTGMGRALAAPDDNYSDWLNMTAHQGPIAPGTVITVQNWQKYQEFMPLGMIDLFEGKYFWKMPPDIEIPVGPTVIHPLAPGFVAATEKYGGQSRFVTLPDGRHDLVNYVSGAPFPNPSGPDKGLQILANRWYEPIPHMLGSTPNNMDNFFIQDRFGNKSSTKTILVYRRLMHNWDPGRSMNDAGSTGVYYTEWLMVEEPEESKYTADLTIYFDDLKQLEDNYVFVPALRRSLRLAVSARCAPLFGSDMVHDDMRGGYNGGLSAFDAEFLGGRKILALTENNADYGYFPERYDMPLGFSKPSWGKWNLRDTNVIDVHRVGSLSAGYCYGKRIMFEDAQFYHEIWEDLYDINMKLWKIVWVVRRALPVPGQGVSPNNGAVLEAYFDLQNDHASYVTTGDHGTDMFFDAQIPPQYNNVSKYSTPGGLMQIMQ